MKKICKYLQEEIQLIDNRIVPCGSRFWDGYNTADKFFIKPDADLKEIDFDYYFKKQQEYIEMYKNGRLPEFCENCTIYEQEPESISPHSHSQIDNNEKNNKTFKKIHINHKTICSARCIYCCLAEEGDLKKFEEINKQKTYDIKPILSDIAEKNLIDENTQICIFGGECTEYPDDLEYIINIGLKYNCSFLIASNGIIYNKNIENLLKTGKIELRFSLDSGSKEIYEKIKRVKAYERVIKNIENYSNAAKNNDNAYIQMKYIICPNINDNIEELKKFFMLADKYKAQQVILSINRFWLARNKQKAVPKSVHDIIYWYFNNQEFSHIVRNTDSDELHDDYVERILKDNNIFQKMKSLLRL